MTIDVWSWNVNGLRAIARAGFLEWLDGTAATFVGVQEVRAERAQLEGHDPRLARPRGWHTGFVAAEKKGYSGVGFYSKVKPDAHAFTLDVPDFDREARYQEVRLGALTIVNAYFPNGNGTPTPEGRRTNSRIPFKLDFYRHLFERLAPRVAAGERLLVMGDFNTAHREIDLARPKSNARTSGFTDVERAELGRWLDHGWVDTWRHVHPERAGVYSWWSQRFGVRERNIGWRLDLVLASRGALPFLRDAFIHDHVVGSDHCPVGVRLDRAILTSAAAPARRATPARARARPATG